MLNFENSQYELVEKKEEEWMSNNDISMQK